MKRFSRRGYYILEGVRRSLACHEAGLKTVPAILYREGQAPEPRRVRLTSLFTSKRTIARNPRFLGIVPPIEVPIAIEPVGARMQPKAVWPLLTVEIT
jgi:hypothetical protein